MEEIEVLKQNLISFILKKNRVTSDELIKWALENRIGILTLSIILEEIIQEKGFQTQGVHRISIIEFKNNLIELSIPKIIEVKKVSTTTTRVKKKERIKQTTLQLPLVEEVKEKKEEKIVKEIQRVEIKPEVKTIEVKEVMVEQKQQIIKPEESIKTKEEISVNEEYLAKLLQNEFSSIDYDKALLLVKQILMYLSRYWSVGLLRLKLDVTRSLSSKLGLNEEKLMDCIDRLLRIMNRLNIVEIVEPGVVNLIQKIFTKSGIKLSEVLEF